MADQPATFEAFIARERDRITKERDDLTTRRGEIEVQLAALDRELQAISAYENVKAGRTPAAAAPRAVRAPSGAGGGTRRTGQREAVLAVIEANTDGITPGAILVAMNAETDTEKTSVRNALSALKRNNSVGARDGKYFPA